MPTPRPSSATRSATRSRTPPVRRSTSSSSCSRRSRSSSPRCSFGSVGRPDGVIAGRRGSTWTPSVQALVMGIVQGLTEFLPVSSSGHLIIVPFLLGWNDPFITSLAFSVMLHIGTLGALLVYFRADWLPARPGRARGRSATARSRATRTAASPGCSSPPRSRRARRLPPQRRHRGRSVPRRLGARRAHARRSAPRSCGSPTASGPRRSGVDDVTFPLALGDRRRPGARPDPGDQPVGHLDLGRPVRRSRPRGGGPVQLPDGDADHRRRRAVRGPQARVRRGRRRRQRRPAGRRAGRGVRCPGMLAISVLLRLPADALARTSSSSTASSSPRRPRRLARPALAAARDGGHEAAPPARDPRPGRAAPDPHPAGAGRRPPRARLPDDAGDDLAATSPSSGLIKVTRDGTAGVRAAAAAHRGRDAPARTACASCSRDLPIEIHEAGLLLVVRTLPGLGPRDRGRARPGALAGGRGLDRRRRHPLRRLPGPRLAAAHQAPAAAPRRGRPERP